MDREYKLLLFVIIGSVAVQTKAERHLFIINKTNNKITVCPTVPSKRSYKEKPLVVESGKSGDWWGKFLDNDSFVVEFDKNWEGNAYWQAVAFGRDTNRQGYHSEVIDPRRDGLYNKDGNVVLELNWFRDDVYPFPYLEVKESGRIYGWHSPKLPAEVIRNKLKRQKKANL